jgi:GntR family transcriptional regulator
MPDPMWKQIAEDLRQKIESGDLGRDGKPLPTELELQAEYSASRNTVRDAIKWLVTRGMVYTRSGQGTFVTQRIVPFVTTLPTTYSRRAGGMDGESTAYGSEVQAMRRRATVSVPRIEIHEATGIAAAELQMPEGDSVVSRHQQRFIDGVPYSLQTTFYPMTLIDRGAVRLIRAADIVEGAVGYIEEAIGLIESGQRVRFTVRVPDATETGFFGLPDDGRIAVFELIRTGFDESGVPFRVTVTTYPADRNEFLMTIGNVPGAEQEPSLSSPAAAGGS